MDEYINALNQSHITVNLTIEKLNRILADFKSEIDENKKIIIEANKIDLEYTDKKIDMMELKKIIDIYKIKPISDIRDDKYIVKYAGDPYLTVHLILQAIVQKCNVLLLTDEYMLGVNKILFTIMKKVLKKYKLDESISFYTMMSGKEMKLLEDTNIPIIVIGDSFTYQLLIHKKNVIFYPYNNILLFYECEEFEDLAEYIVNYAYENEYEIEVVEEEEMNDAITEINLETDCDVAIFLVKNSDSENIRNAIKDKKVYINENPFSKATGRIYNYFAE